MLPDLKKFSFSNSPWRETPGILQLMGTTLVSFSIRGLLSGCSLSHACLGPWMARSFSPLWTYLAYSVLGRDQMPRSTGVAIGLSQNTLLLSCTALASISSCIFLFVYLCVVYSPCSTLSATRAGLHLFYSWPHPPHTALSHDGSCVLLPPSMLTLS